MESTGEQIE